MLFFYTELCLVWSALGTRPNHFVIPVCRVRCVLKLLEKFVEEYFYLNPIREEWGHTIRCLYNNVTDPCP